MCVARREGDWMTRMRISVACCLVLGAMTLPAASASADESTHMIGKINNVRANHGLKPVRHAPSLARSADSYARTMMARDFFGHGSQINAPKKFRRLGEAIALGRGRARAGRALRGWLHSPGHRALVLSPSFRFMGAGRSRGSFRGSHATIWVLHLGAR